LVNDLFSKPFFISSSITSAYKQKKANLHNAVFWEKFESKKFSKKAKYT